MANPRKTTYGTKVYEQSAAQWAADTRVFDVNVILVPTDGADKGKHKLANGIDTYSGLPFVEDGGGGGASVYLDGVAQSGIYTKVLSSVNGQLTIDWTAETPALSSVKVLSVFVQDSPIISARVRNPLVGSMEISLYDLQTMSDSTDSGIEATVTVMGIEA